MMPSKRRHPGLEAVIRRGARRHQHQYVAMIGAAIPATLVTAAANATLYMVILASAGRTDWYNIIVGAAGAAAIPIVAISFLFLMTRRDHPVTLALAATAFAGSLLIAFLSATRIPISFIALLASLPMTAVGVSFANVSLARALKKSVAVLDFPGALKVASLIGRAVQVVSAQDVGANIHRLLIDPVAHHTPEYATVLARLYLRGVALETWPVYLEGHLGKVDIKTFDLGDISYSPSQLAYYRTKRLMDVAAVALLLTPAAVICSMIWVYIRLIDGGPSLFVQERRGYAGSVFRLYKFRTMRLGDHVGSTTINDDRILPGCVLLRQLRLDELPQLFNILKGDMSFIGPRPVSIEVASALEAKLPQYINRQILFPGLTGWAQVSQGYAESEDEEVEKLSYDLFYLKHVSLDLDIIITARTFRTILLRQGAR
ncbi:sugar transferase [uncultured Devosia sp.]|uniref:sugar transferase n=1 Tax=uncultured Devosia sp. TaxID=211434 RepID=UPI0035CB1A8A